MRGLLATVFFFSSISAVNASSTEFVLLDGVEHYQTDIEISNEGSLHVTETLRLHVTHKPLILKHLRSFTSGKLALAKVILNQQELPLAKQGWYQLSRLELDQQHALGQGHHVLVLDYHLPRYIDKNTPQRSLLWNATGLDWPGLVKVAAVHITIPDYHYFLEIGAKSGMAENNQDYQIVRHQENEVKLETTRYMDASEPFIVKTSWTQ